MEATEAVEASDVSDARKIIQYVHWMLFLIFEAKEAVEVIEASDVIMSVEVIEATKVFRTTQILRIKNLMAKSSYFDLLRKNIFLIDSLNFSEILPALKTEAVEERDVAFIQIKGSYVKCPQLRMPKPTSNQI